MPIAITTVSASKVGTTFDAPTSWTAITDAFVLASLHACVLHRWYTIVLSENDYFILDSTLYIKYIEFEELSIDRNIIKTHRRFHD